MNKLTFSDDTYFRLLIGTNNTKTLEPIEIFQKRNGGNYNFKT